VVALCKRSIRHNPAHGVLTRNDEGYFSYRPPQQLHWSGYVHLRAAPAGRAAVATVHLTYECKRCAVAIDDAYTMGGGHVADTSLPPASGETI